MLIDIALSLFLIGGLVALAVLVIKKIPVLRITNPTEVGKFEQQQIRQQLVITRLKRQLSNIVKKFRALVNRANQGNNIKKNTIQTTLSGLEETINKIISEKTSPQRTIADYINQAEESLRKENYTVAEEAYLKVLEMDPHQLPAYQGLGEVYLDQRDFEAAREVYEFLLKRGRAATSSLGLARVASGQGRLEEAKDEYLGALQLTSTAQPRIELAQIMRDMGDFPGALKYLKEARKIEPQNPKILDFFIEVSILNGQPNQAKESLEALRQANPDNQKIAEFAREIRKLEHKQKPKHTSRSKRGTNFGLPTSKR